MLEITKVIFPAIIGLVSGVLSAWFAAHWRLKQVVASFELEQKKEQELLEKRGFSKICG